MRFTAIVLAFAAVAQAANVSHLEKYKDDFARHVQKYKVEIFGEEAFEERLSIFAKNVEFINAHNSANNHTYTLGKNQFTHLTFDEFSDIYLGTTPPMREERYINDFADVNAPDTIDWSGTDAVTPVKDQGNCGSCWAFSATGAVEGAYFLKHKKQVSFSEQQLVSCSWAYKNSGCFGGLMNQAFEYIHDTGLCSENDYPYVDKDNVSMS